MVIVSQKQQHINGQREQLMIARIRGSVNRLLEAVIAQKSVNRTWRPNEERSQF